MGLVSDCLALLETNGYVVLRSHLPRKDTIEAISHLGQLLHLAGIHEKQELKPRESWNSPPNTYSGNYGRGEFPLHTDLAHWVSPPHYFALRCIVGAQGVATNLLDSKKLVAAFGVNELRRILVHPRRAFAGRRPLLRLLDRTNSEPLLFRWDKLFIQPATAFSGGVMSEVERSISEAVTIQVHLISKGDTLIVDNWRMLHGRSSVNDISVNRLIERVYLEEVY